MPNSNSQIAHLLEKQKLQEQKIRELEESHNEQVHLINQYKQRADEKTKFSLEMINNSMEAVDLIRKYKNDGNRKGQENQSFRREAQVVEQKINKCQEAIQNDLIPQEQS